MALASTLMVSACIGPAGADGFQGLHGIQGPVGPADPIGATGPQGPAGPQGSAGTVEWLGYRTGEVASGRGADCMLGEILLTASTVDNRLPANGQFLPIQQFTALFSLYGTRYGGDGITTFALPDLRPLTPDYMAYSVCMAGVYAARD
ncbi:phage tail protein [Demequina sediminis]|nr:tail fiber protein [Demequina sediminis]